MSKFVQFDMREIKLFRNELDVDRNNVESLTITYVPIDGYSLYVFVFENSPELGKNEERDAKVQRKCEYQNIEF